MTGYAPEELLNMTVRQITFPGDSEWDNRMLRKLIEGGAPEAPQSRRYVCKDGKIIWVDVASILICDSQGLPWRTSTVIQDVTARKHAEEALRAAQLQLRELGAGNCPALTKIS